MFSILEKAAGVTYLYAISLFRKPLYSICFRKSSRILVIKLRGGAGASIGMATVPSWGARGGASSNRPPPPLFLRVGVPFHLFLRGGGHFLPSLKGGVHSPLCLKEGSRFPPLKKG